jgi:PKD repeat protein
MFLQRSFNMKYLFLLFLLSFLTACSLVETLTEESEPPAIVDMKISPNGAAAPVLSVVSWKIAADPKETVNCSIDFGDGTKEPRENCAQLTDIFHNYEKPGGYILVLTAQAGRYEVKRSLPVLVQAPQAPNGAPAGGVTALSLSPDKGPAPLLSAVKWQISGMKEPVNCTVDFGDGVVETVPNCTQVTGLNHTYLNPGNYPLRLVAKDAEREVSKSLPVVVEAPK